MIGVALKPVPFSPVSTAGGPARLSYSSADQTALALALDLGRRLDLPVHAASAGAVGTTALLDDVIRAGASEAIWFPASASASTDAVARRLADAFQSARFVICGDYSSDRGSGALPALLAAELGIGQALGLVLVAPNSDGLKVARRLDGGELQHLVVRGRCVLSVSPGTALPVRVSLPAMLSAPRTAVRVGLAVDQGRRDDVVRRPHRPRSKDILVPAGDVKMRLETILGFDAGAPRQRTVLSLPPDEAARRIVHWIAANGYTVGQA